MRRMFFLAAFAVFVWMAPGAARAQVTLGDVARLGLLRKAEIFPGAGGSIASPTSGVLRIVDYVPGGVDSNKCVLTVLTNLVGYMTGDALDAGVYEPLSLSWSNTVMRATFSNMWSFVSSSHVWRAHTEGLSVDGTQVLSETNFLWGPLMFPAVQTPFFTASIRSSAPTCNFACNKFSNGDWGVVVTSSVPTGQWMASNVLEDAEEIVLTPHASTPLAAGTFILTREHGAVLSRNDGTINRAVFFDSAWSNAYPMALGSTAVRMPSSRTKGFAEMRLGLGLVRATNDFVSVTRLQDAIDDLRQEMAEAIEAHVQLLHP